MSKRADAIDAPANSPSKSPPDGGEHARSRAREHDPLLRQSPFAIVELDLEGRITYTNWTPDHFQGEVFVGAPSLNKSSPMDRERYREALDRVRQHGETVHLEVQDAYDSWWQTWMSPIRDHDGQIRSIGLFARDCTEDRKLRTKVEDVQRLESLGLLAGGIAHDFNNLLVAVMGNADLAALGLPEDAPTHKFLNEIVRSAERAAELCSELLAYSGRSRFTIHTVDLREVVRDVLRMLRVTLCKRAALDVDLGDTPLPVEVDVTQLRQVIMNVVTNASDALEQGPGTIRVRAGMRSYGRSELCEGFVEEFLAEGSYAYLDVIDDGVGMDADTRARIFEPFFSSKSHGRGLGLAAVLGILRGHRGAIRVDSEPAVGTQVTVLLPASPRATQALEHRQRARASWQGHGTILVADDEEGVRRFARRTLELAGFEVLVARDGREATALYGEHRDRIRAVILDLVMPEQGGLATLAELRRSDPSLPMLVSSGYNDQEDALRELSEDRSALFIPKPYRVADLLGALETLLADG